MGMPIAVVVNLAGGSKSCPDGTRVVSGGAFWRNPFAGIVADGTLGSSVPKGKAASDAAGAPGSTSNRALVLVLLCRPL